MQSVTFSTELSLVTRSISKTSLADPTSFSAPWAAQGRLVKRPHFRELMLITGVQLESSLSANSTKMGIP